MVRPSRRMRAEHGLAHAGDGFQQFALAVAGDAGDADDLARTNREGDIGDPQHAARIDDGEVVDLEQRRAGSLLGLLDTQEHAPSHHQLGQFRRRGVGRLEGRHHLAAAHDRDAIGDRHDLAQLVGDENDGLALLLERAKQLEQRIGLGRREHGGGLVEDEDVRAAIERFQDLDALLQADGEIADDRIRVDLEPVILCQPRELRARLRFADAQHGAAFGAEHDVLDDGEGLDEHEVLVHHADAGMDGIVRRADGNRLAVDTDLAGIGLVEAVQDRHQRRFAGAVLADDAVDRPALDA